MKNQIKIALLFTILCTLIIVVLSTAVYYFAHEKAFEDFYVRLELRATIAAKVKLHNGSENTTAYKEVRYQYLQRLPQEKEYIMPIDSLSFFAKSNMAEVELPESFYSDISTKGSASYRKGYQFFKGIYYSTEDGDYAIILSAIHTYALNFLTNLKTILITANIISMIVIFTIGMFFSKQVLAPIRRITQQVNNISATSLHRRLKVKKGEDEIAELGHTFNIMLSRLETSFETQNNFVSNASHELNTPLTTIIGEAELALAKPRTPVQYQAALEVIQLQADRLKNMTKSLLELAQSGFRGNLSLEVVPVMELLQNVNKIASSMYPDCRLETNSSLQPAAMETLSVNGNFHLLELCLSNIVLNACKYAAGNTVTLALATTDRYVVFIIKDQGIGIPEQEMPHIFDPFFRASNVKHSKGYGIGLPLAQNIIRLHHGVIQVSSKEAEGTEVILKIPKASAG